MEKSCNPILLVEDDADIRTTITDLLTDEGFHVVTAQNGQEALERLESLPHPCLILLDLFMPILDGKGFIQQLKKERSDVVASLPIVVLSAAANPKAELGSEASQPIDFLRKPVDLDRFLTTIQQFCNPMTSQKAA